MSRFAGKRFAAFLMTLLVIAAGFWMHHAETFGALAQYVTALFGAYVAGQSATDWKHGSEGTK